MMECIGLILREMRVPTEWVWSECCVLPMTHFHPKGDYKAFLQGFLPDVSPFVQERMRGHVNEGRACGFDFAFPAVLHGDGRFSILDGQHRCALAIAAGRRDLRLEVRHVSPLWSALEEDLTAIYGAKRLYQRIEHPWFADWDVTRSDRRFDAIKGVVDQLPIPKPSMTVDVGSCTGWLCRRFAEAGYYAVGFDSDRRIVRIADWLNMVFPRNAATFYIGDGLDPVRAFTPQHITVLTCLSVLHHFLWDEGAGPQPARFLQWLRSFAKHAGLVFIDLPARRDARLKTDVPLEPSAFGRWLVAECGVKSWRLLGTAGDSHGREIVAFSNVHDLDGVRVSA